MKFDTKNWLKTVKVAAVTTAISVSAVVAPAHAEKLGYPEKEELKFGFIKLTDMAPIAIAYENGYFEDEGLYVTIEAQANWKVLLDGVIDGVGVGVMFPSGHINSSKSHLVPLSHPIATISIVVGVACVFIYSILTFPLQLLDVEDGYSVFTPI